jgi:hypothetical protein
VVFGVVQVMDADRVSGSEKDQGRLRFQLYWALSGLATLVFLLFVFLMMMVPGVPDTDKLWMLSISSVLLLIPLLVGVWKFDSSDAPLTSWPLGPLVSVILLIELTWCVASLVAILMNRR